MTSPKKKETLTKLSFEELEELYERQKSILKNTDLINKLPDRGKQLQDKCGTVEKELNLRRDLKELEGTLKTLTINSSNAEILKEKHVQHICSIEKLSTKEQYKPFATLTTKVAKNKTENPTQLISLVESMSLLTDQATKLPVEQARKAVEGTEMKHNDTACGEEDEELVD